MDADGAAAVTRRGDPRRPRPAAGPPHAPGAAHPHQSIGWADPAAGGRPPAPAPTHFGGSAGGGFGSPSSGVPSPPVGLFGSPSTGVPSPPAGLFAPIDPILIEAALADSSWLADFLVSQPPQAPDASAPTPFEVSTGTSTRSHRIDPVKSMIGTVQDPSLLLELWTSLLAAPPFDFHPTTINRLHHLTTSVRWEAVFRRAYLNWIAPEQYPLRDSAYEVWVWMFNE
eukprot:gene609-1958_t